VLVQLDHDERDPDRDDRDEEKISVNRRWTQHIYRPLSPAERLRSYLYVEWSPP